MTQVQNIASLIDLCEQNKNEFFILLNGGLRSSKTIYFDGRLFDIIHEVDFSDSTMSIEELSDSFIGEALQKGALYCYE